VPQLRLLTDREWHDAHERLTATRESYLRGKRGKLWGRPTNGIESKYLLTGLARCGECGGSLYVRSRSHGAHHALFYGCTSYHLRGRTVCTNYMELPLLKVDRAVLSTIEADLLQPDILEDAIQEAIAMLRPSEDAAALQRKKLEQELATVDSALARLTAAIESGGDVPTLVKAMKDRKQDRAAVQQQLANLAGLGRLQTVDAQTLRRNLEARLTHWQGLRSRHVAQTRQILRKLLVGRLRFTFDATQRTCKFTGQGALDPELAGVLGAKTLVSHLISNWNPLIHWLEEVALLQKTLKRGAPDNKSPLLKAESLAPGSSLSGLESVMK
jgi:hypothetical protein